MPHFTNEKHFEEKLEQDNVAQDAGISKIFIDPMETGMYFVPTDRSEEDMVCMSACEGWI